MQDKLIKTSLKKTILLWGFLGLRFSSLAAVVKWFPSLESHKRSKDTSFIVFVQLFWLQNNQILHF